MADVGCRPHRSSQAERKAAARLLARQSKLFIGHLLVTGNWCVMSLVYQNTVPHICVHHHWHARQCSIPCLRSAPALCRRRLPLSRAAELDLKDARVCARARHGPAILAYIWHAHIHAHHQGSASGLQCFYYAQHPCPPCPVFLGAGAEPNPEAEPSGAVPSTGKISKAAKIGGNHYPGVAIFIQSTPLIRPPRVDMF